MKREEAKFPVDGALIRVLSRAGVSIRNPDVRPLIFYDDGNKYAIEMRIDADPEEKGEMEVIRRVPLDNITADEWEDLKDQYAQLDLNLCITEGISKGLEGIEETPIQRLFIALLTYLNPRQKAIVLYLYREAALENATSSPEITFRSNNLLEALGYKRAKDGSFPSVIRSQLHRDLMTLHNIQLIFAKSLEEETGRSAEVTIKSVLRVKRYRTDNVPRDFDLSQAASYTYELADEYTVSLEFFEGIHTGDVVRYPNTISLEQKQGRNAKYDYTTELLIYLGSRLKWDRPDENQYLTISKQYLLKNLGLFGANKSRNNTILWRTIEELREQGYILEARELPGKRNKMTNVQIQVNPEKIYACG